LIVTTTTSPFAAIARALYDEPDPFSKAPPWIHTITGSGRAWRSTGGV
jgi:hypothetical protein